MIVFSPKQKAEWGILTKEIIRDAKRGSNNLVQMIDENLDL